MTDHAIPNAAVLSGWLKSSYSDPNGGSCLEVLDNRPSGVPVRDSKNPYGPAVVFPAPGWRSFVAAVKGGDFSA